MQMNEYLSVFIDESKEHLQTMNDYLMELEASPDDLAPIPEIFRSAHTLKGMSAAMGFEDLAALTHEMENVLDGLRHNQLNVTEQIVDLLFACLDRLESMVDDIISGGTGEEDVTQLVAQLLDVINGGDGHGGKAASENEQAKQTILDEFQLSVLQQSLESGYSAYYLKVAISPECVLKAARAYMVFDLLEQHGEVIKAIPSVEEIEQEQFQNEFSVFYISERSAAELEQKILNISEITTVQVQEVNESTIHTFVDQAQAQKETAAAVQTPKKEREEKVDRAKKVPQQGRTIRVDLERLDQLMNLFSELLIDRVRLEDLAKEINRSDLTDTVEHMTRVSTDLQNIVLNLRMVSVEAIFNRFPRMVRDIAKSLDKKVELIITGEDTELDRTVIDEIGDPLVHLLRNSLDHGLEDADERLKAGKSETGTIWLRAYQSGNEVFIEIEDNGRGINREKVLNKAIENGLVSEEEGQQLTDNEVYQLLFAPGFSTAEQVTDLSGRGVGLDVVRGKIVSLGGNILVESTPGQGSKFTVQLPLTLSIISAMLIRVSNERYALPLSSILETSIVTHDQILHVHGNKMLNFRESIIPVIYLHDLLECPGERKDEDELYAVIIHKGDKQAAVIVDEFIGQQEIVLKSLGNYLQNVFAVSGATILGDGQVALILDPNSLIL